MTSKRTSSGKWPANHAFVDKLLRAKDLQEAFRLQAEYFQSQLKAAAEDAAKLGSKMAGAFNRPTSGSSQWL